MTHVHPLHLYIGLLCFHFTVPIDQAVQTQFRELDSIPRTAHAEYTPLNERKYLGVSRHVETSRFVSHYGVVSFVCAASDLPSFTTKT